jgi:hypothetical protein
MKDANMHIQKRTYIYVRMIYIYKCVCTSDAMHADNQEKQNN